MPPAPFAPLDLTIHAPVRLAIMSSLVGVERMDFITLRDATNTTDGNLATHAAKLEKAGYIEVRKRFVDRKPRTTYRITDAGRSAFLNYLDVLSALLPKHPRE